MTLNKMIFTNYSHTAYLSLKIMLFLRKKSPHYAILVIPLTL